MNMLQATLKGKLYLINNKQESFTALLCDSIGFFCVIVLVVTSWWGYVLQLHLWIFTFISFWVKIQEI